MRRQAARPGLPHGAEQVSAWYVCGSCGGRGFVEVLVRPAGRNVDMFDIGGCGCMIDEVSP